MTYVIHLASKQASEEGLTIPTEWETKQRPERSRVSHRLKTSVLFYSLFFLIFLTLIQREFGPLLLVTHKTLPDNSYFSKQIAFLINVPGEYEAH